MRRHFEPQMECGPLESVVWGCALAVSVQRSDMRSDFGHAHRAHSRVCREQGQLSAVYRWPWAHHATGNGGHSTPLAMPHRRGRLVDLTVTVTVPLAACALTRSALPAYREASRTPVPCAGTLGRAPCSSRAAGPLLFEVHRAACAESELSGRRRGPFNFKFHKRTQTSS